MSTSTKLRRAEITACFACGKGVAHAGDICFYRVSLQQFVLDPSAIQRQHGLEMQIGNAALAQIMGPDSPLAQSTDEQKTSLLCQQCATRDMGMLLVLTEEQTA